MTRHQILTDACLAILRETPIGTWISERDFMNQVRNRAGGFFANYAGQPTTFSSSEVRKATLDACGTYRVYIERESISMPYKGLRRMMKILPIG